MTVERVEVELAQVDLRVKPDDARGRIELPFEPNSWSALSAGGREALWLGPDEWLVVGPAGSQVAIVGDLDAKMDGVHRSVVDVSANRGAFDLTGAERHDLLGQGCGLDLHPRSWRAGLCAQTLMGRVPVILQERDDATRVFVRPSFAAHLFAWIDATRG